MVVSNRCYWTKVGYYNYPEPSAEFSRAVREIMDDGKATSPKEITKQLEQPDSPYRDFLPNPKSNTLTWVKRALQSSRSSLQNPH
jgi:hypothetical protein